MSFRSLASLRVAVSFAALLVLSACSDNRQAQLSAVETIEIPAADAGQQANQNIGNPTLVIPDTFPVAEGDELTLVWSDEFDGPEIDPEVWFFAAGDGTEKGLPGGWGNNELQYYLPDNAQIVNGVLEITARRENVGGLNYSSARINTEDRFAFKYGRIEASIKLPAGQGLWPAFWMLSQDSDYLCGGEPCIWAAIGEIDIMEAVNLGGTGGNEIFGTLHHGGEAPANVFTGDTYTPSVDVTESFNTYALEWDEDEIRWYFNGQLYAMQNSWNSSADGKDFPAPFDQNFHVLLNLAVGGNFPGAPNGTTPFPATMEVDWVRVYSGEDPDGGVATEPNASAPTPTVDAAGVISVYSDAYDDIAGVNYNPPWNQATVFTEAQIAGNKMLKYAGLDYQGIDFAGNPQDVSGKGYLHLDFWTADSTALNVYLISLGAETPYVLPVTPNSWVSVNVLLSEFTGVDLTNVIQLKFDGNGTIFLDNLYFAGEAPITAPTAAATTPTEDAGDVVSLFSNAYTDVTVGDFSTTWDTADVSDVQVAGDDVKLYVPTGGGASLGFIGINFDNANAIDGTGYDTLRMDIWTPDVTNLLVKLVDFGGDGFEGANADTTGTSTQTLTQGSWQTISIPFSEFMTNGLAGVTELSQIVLEDLDGATGGTTLYVDNLYFFNSAGSGGGGTAPTAAATTPTEDAGDVVSLFSNAYTDVAVGDFSTTWDTADVSDVQVAGDDVKLYVPTGGNATLGFIGINFDNANAIDGTGYDTLRMDVWTPDVTNLLVKLVDFGGDGFEGANADTTGTSTQTLTQGSWQTISIPFSEFMTNGLAGVTELSQIVLEDLDGAAGGTTLYVDNLYFFNSAGSGGGGTAPTAAATTPTEDAGDVVSLFSNAYTDVAVGDFSTTWDTADVSDVQVAGDDVKLYVPTGGNATLGFIGINFDNANAIDGTGYDTLRMDIWTPDVTNLLVKLVDFGGDGFEGANADTTGTSTQTLTQGSWQTISIPFSEFMTNGLAGVTELSQIVLEDLDGATGGTTLYVDNLYFFNSAGSGGGGGTVLATFDEVPALAVANFGGAGFVIEIGPAGGDGTNALNIVRNGGEVWAGAWVAIPTIPSDAGTQTVSALVYSPTAGIPMVAKAEYADNAGTGEVPANETVVVGWQTLTWTFTNLDPAQVYNRFVMLPNLGTVDTATSYFFDNITLLEAGGGVDPFDDGLLTNGDFEDGVGGSWIGNALNVVDDGGNFVTSANVEVAGDAFNVNLSQVLTITQDETYTLTFKARSDGARTMLAGIGLNEDPWTNVTEIVNLTAEWQTFELEFTATGFGNANSRVLFDMGADTGLVLIDDVSLVVTTGGGSAAGDIAINGGFETGLFNDGSENASWQQFPGGGIQTITTDNPSSGTYAANLNVPVRTQTDPAVDNLIKNANLQAGNLTPGESVTVSFDMRGSLSGAGGVVFAEFFSELSGGGTSKAEIFTGGPLAPTPDWTTYSYTTTLGPDVSGGATLQLKASCGPVEGCGVDVFFDNVTIVIGGTGGGGGGSGGGGGGGATGSCGGVGELVINCDFETGAFNDGSENASWQQFPGDGTQTIITDNPSSGTYAANLNIPVRGVGDPGVDNLIKNANLGAGTLAPNASITVSFDMRGSLEGEGAVVFAELFSELSGGGTSKSEILFGGGPIFPNEAWTVYSATTTLGPDVTGGVTLQLKVGCGAVVGCGADVYFDNVSIVIN